MKVSDRPKVGEVYYNPGTYGWVDKMQSYRYRIIDATEDSAVYALVGGSQGGRMGGFSYHSDIWKSSTLDTEYVNKKKLDKQVEDILK